MNSQIGVKDFKNVDHFAPLPHLDDGSRDMAHAQ